MNWEDFETDEGKFQFAIEFDDDNPAPWENEDGHGPVSEWRRAGYRGHPSKAPGERPLCADGSSARFYDFAAAVRIARRDGWGHSKMHDGETPGQRAAAAAEEDFRRLRRWCDGDWCYVGVVVRMCDDYGDPISSDTASLWGIESDCEEYIRQVAKELAADLVAETSAGLARIA